MPFELAPASLSDVPEIVEVAIAGFASDSIFRQMKQDCLTSDLVECFVPKYSQGFEMPGVNFFKVVDTENGNIAAFCKWGFPHEVESIKTQSERPQGPLPKGYNDALRQELSEKLSASRAQFMDASKDYFVNMLAVHPSYQRKGLGRILLKHGLALADRDGAKTYLEASEVGLGLYLSLDWVKVGEIEIDLKKYGAGRVVVVPCLVREPQSLATSL